MTDPERPRLTFFFPAYNEEENVEETTRRALGIGHWRMPSM